MSHNRIQINGVDLRCGRTFVARVTAPHIVGAGAATRYTTLKSVYVRTKRAVATASNPRFLTDARRKRVISDEYDSALTHFEIACKKPNLTAGDAAMAVAHLVLDRRRDIETRKQRDNQNSCHVTPWDVEIGNWDATCEELNDNL